MKLSRLFYGLLYSALYECRALMARDSVYIFTKQDRMRVQLSKMELFDSIGKDECCTLINKWKLENIDDREYRRALDVGIRQICDHNIFPVLVNIPKAQYIIINFVTENNVSVINILDNKGNTQFNDKAILEYHIFLVEQKYNPNYYQLKSHNMKHFLNIFFLNILSEEENKLIYLKKNDYMRFLEEDTKNRRRDKI